MQEYLDEHLLRSFTTRHNIQMARATFNRAHGRSMRRRMSVKGAIKKTRSINVDSKSLGFFSHLFYKQLQLKHDVLLLFYLYHLFLNV